MKIIQIMPADGWYARLAYEEAKGKSSSDLTPLVCWALIEDDNVAEEERENYRSVVGFTADCGAAGYNDEIESSTNFIGYEYHPGGTKEVVKLPSWKERWKEKKDFLDQEQKAFERREAAKKEKREKEKLEHEQHQTRNLDLQQRLDRLNAKGK